MIKFYKKFSTQILVISILLITFLSHVSYLNNGFVWLDHGDIEGGRTIIPFQDFHIMLATRFGATSFFRPLVTFANSVDFIIFKANSSGYHLTNILLHVAAVFSVYLFISIFFKFSLKEKLIATLIFGVHPLSWLPVGAIAYRPELLFTLFTLLTIYFHAKARLEGKELFKAAAAGSFLLALFSKETAVAMIPTIIVLWEIIYRKTKIKQEAVKPKRSIWTLYFAEVIIFLIYSMFRQRAVPELWQTTYPSLSVPEAIGTRLVITARLIIEMINPLKPSLSDAVHITSFFSPIPILFVITLVLLIIGAIQKGITSDFGKTAILFLIMLAPALSIVPVPRIGSPHYGYFPLVAFSVLVILFSRYLLKKIPDTFNKFVPRDVFVYSLLASWIIIMTITTYLSGPRFKNDFTLFYPEVIQDPHFLEGYFHIGNYFVANNNLNEAERYYFKAKQSDVKYLAYYEKPSVLTNLAGIYLQRNELEKADVTITEAESLIRGETPLTLFHNRMILYHKKGNYKAVYELSQDNRAFPYSPAIYLILADSYHNLNMDSEAVKLLTNLLPLINQDEQQKVQELIKNYSSK